MGKPVFVLGGARTPIGTFFGGLSSLSPTQLGVIAAKEALNRSKVDPEKVGTVILGNVLQSARDSVYLARHVGLEAGVPMDRPALIVNRLCLSGMEAVIQGVRAIESGECDYALVGGAENMSMIPHAIRGMRAGFRMGNQEVDDLLVSALFDAHSEMQIGQSVEYSAKKLGLTRAEVDQWAMMSHQRAGAATEETQKEIVPVEIKTRKGITSLTRDENPRPESNLEVLSSLKPLYGEGLCTAGNSSGLNDGACMLVLASERVRDEFKVDPLGRIVDWDLCGVDPKDISSAMAISTRRLLDKMKIGEQDIGRVEINDPFAAMFFSFEKEFKFSREVINPNGGGVAYGHPMGATGARMILTSLMGSKTEGYALCTISAGGGQGAALLLE